MVVCRRVLEGLLASRAAMDGSHASEGTEACSARERLLPHHHDRVEVVWVQQREVGWDRAAWGERDLTLGAI